MSCDQGFSATDLVSLGVAAAALITAAATLYYAALRRASLDLDVIHAVLIPGGWDAPAMPREGQANLRLFWVNSGATGTFLEYAEVSDFHYEGDGPPLWTGLDETHSQPQLTGTGIHAVFEHGDAASGFAVVHFARSPEVTTPEEVARRSARLRSVEFTLSWGFRRAKLLLPSRRRETQIGRKRIVLAGDDYREANIAEWRKTDGLQHLIDLTEGREPDPPTEGGG